jgi:hypothetical protein
MPKSALIAGGMLKGAQFAFPVKSISARPPTPAIKLIRLRSRTVVRFVGRSVCFSQSFVICDPIQVVKKYRPPHRQV